MFNNITKHVSVFLIIAAIRVILENTHLRIAAPEQERESTRREKLARKLPLMDYVEPMEILYEHDYHARALDLFFRHQLAVVNMTMQRTMFATVEQSSFCTNEVTDPQGQRDLKDAARKVWNRVGLNFPENVNSITASWSMKDKRFALSIADDVKGVETIHFLRFLTNHTKLEESLINNADANKREHIRKTFRNLYEQIQLAYYFYPEKAEA